MKKLFLIFFLFNILPLWMIGMTGDSLNYLTAKDTVFLNMGLYQEKIFQHKLAKKQTLFSLAQFYGLNLTELYAYNPALKNRIPSIGQVIRIPIPNKAILRYKPADYHPYLYVPVCYKVKKGDTMFRISRYFFRMPMDTILSRNGLSSFDLKMGQIVLIGWMKITGIPDDIREITGGPLQKLNKTYKRKFIRESYFKKEREHQGVAFWQKDMSLQTDFYALHRKAPLNSIISVTNPMKKRTVFVKVIGKIPDSAYRNDVVVVLSPTEAKILGAKDSRFFVKVKYLR
ncbi:MAG: LysM peptidoglycan-binding domain-containing protein [Bacteroidetes bacterium]|nr:LysM peptidoglycan-binding domain-containing protein [Bacteroidota bacterium]